jgi:hypothetical protein
MLIIAAGIAVVLAACGPQGKSITEKGSADILPEQIEGTGWKRAPELGHFAGDSLFEYINGAAEMYHKYGFVEVTVAEYSKDEATITADVYLFEGTDNAFGMYSTLRPDGPDTVSLGVEGFALGPNLVFVKGAYLVNAYTYDDFERNIAAVRSVAQAVEAGIPGTSEKPATFGLFPILGRVPFSEKIFAEGFLSHGFLTDVYVAEYEVGEDRVRLFITPDSDGEKLRRWQELAGAGPDATPAWLDGVFEPGESLHTVHDYHGEIVAGRRGGKLVGVVGHIPAYRASFTVWAGSLN